MNWMEILILVYWKNYMCCWAAKHDVLSADDTVCNESLKSSSNSIRAIPVNQPPQPKLAEKAHITNALNGSTQKLAHGMFSL